MIGEIFEIYLSQMAKNVLKLSTVVGENSEIYMSQMAKNALKLSTMFGENFEIYLSRITKNAILELFTQLTNNISNEKLSKQKNEK